MAVSRKLMPVILSPTEAEVELTAISFRLKAIGRSEEIAYDSSGSIW